MFFVVKYLLFLNRDVYSSSLTFRNLLPLSVISQNPLGHIDWQLDQLFEYPFNATDTRATRATTLDGEEENPNDKEEERQQN